MLLGLWVVLAGGAHYLIIMLNYKQQRKFMENYIADARKAAWGSSGLGSGLNLDVLGDSGTPPPSGPQGNRKARRAAKAGGNGSGTATPTTEKPVHVAKRKVTSENGKVFMVTSLGDVSLVEEDEDGVTQEYLLDLEEIPKAQWKNTAMVTVPLGLVNLVKGKLGLGGGAADAINDALHGVEVSIADGVSAIDEALEKKGLKKRTKGPGRK